LKRSRVGGAKAAHGRSAGFSLYGLSGPNFLSSALGASQSVGVKENRHRPITGVEDVVAVGEEN